MDCPAIEASPIELDAQELDDKESIDLQDYKQQLNRELKQSGSQFMIDIKGRRLSLRGYFDVGDGSGRKQRRISLRLKVTKFNLDRAKQEAIRLTNMEDSKITPIGFSEHDMVKVKFAEIKRASIEVPLSEDMRCDFRGKNYIGEVKAERARARHLAQLLNYMAEAGVKKGFLVARSFEDGVMGMIKTLSRHGIEITAVEYSYQVVSQLNLLDIAG